MVKASARGQPEDRPYSSRIIKAMALLADTALLLSEWDPTASSETNLARIRNQSIFGKASRSTVQGILAAFRQRYLQDPLVLR